MASVRAVDWVSTLSYAYEKGYYTIDDVAKFVPRRINEEQFYIVTGVTYQDYLASLVS